MFDERRKNRQKGKELVHSNLEAGKAERGRRFRKNARDAVLTATVIGAPLALASQVHERAFVRRKKERQMGQMYRAGERGK